MVEDVNGSASHKSAFRSGLLLLVICVGVAASGCGDGSKFGQNHPVPPPPPPDPSVANNLFDDGYRMLDSGQPGDALTCFQAASTIFEKLPNRATQLASCHGLIGNALYELGRYEEAVEEQKKELAILIEIAGTEKAQIIARMELGRELCMLEYFTEGVAEIKKAQVLCDRFPEDNAKATERCRELLRQYESCVSPGGEKPRPPLTEEQKRARFEARRQFANAVSFKDDTDCLVGLRSALALWEKVSGSERNQAYCHGLIATQLRKLGRNRETIEEAQKALDMYSGLSGTDIEQADCRNMIGPIILKVGRKGSEHIPDFPMSPGVDLVNNGLRISEGHKLRDEGRLKEALETYRAALDGLARLKGVATVEASVRHLVARTLNELGCYEQAISELNEALSALSALPGTVADQLEIRSSLCRTLGNLGRYEEEIAAETTLLNTVFALPGMEHSRVACHNNIANWLNRLGRQDEAMDEIQKATDICVEFKYNVEEYDVPLCLLSRGAVFEKLGRYDEALQEVRCAMAIFSRMDDSEEVLAVCHSVIGRLYIRQGKYAAAEAALIPLRKKLSHKGIDQLLALAEQGQGDANHLASALRYWLSSMHLIEEQRKAIVVPENQMSWFEERAPVYEELASLLTRMGRENMVITEPEARQWGTTPAEMAVHFLDRGKGRTLLELVLARELEAKDAESRELMAEMRRLNTEINTLLVQRGPDAKPGNLDDFSAAAQQIEKKQTRKRELEAEMRKTTAGAFIESDLLKPAQFCKTLAQGEACLEYAACEKELLVFLVTSRGVNVFRTEIVRDVPRSLREKGQPDLNKLVAAYRRFPDKPESLGLEGMVWMQRERMDRWQKPVLSEAEHIAVSQSLGSALLPVKLRQALTEEKVKHLVIVPSRILAFISFSTLILGPAEKGQPIKTFASSRFLVQDYSVSYVQTLSLLGASRKRALERERAGTNNRLFIALADPIYDDSDTRAAILAPVVEAPHIEAERAGADAVVRGLLRNVGIAPDASLGLRWNRLPETRAEAEAAAKNFGKYQVLDQSVPLLSTAPTGVVCVGYAANRPLAKSRALGSYRNILFSTHGYSDMLNPWLSSLMLTDIAAERGNRQPAPLTMADIFELSLQADTVMLAACQTALGRMRVGEGIVGFALAFQFAGADSVVLTQWEVPSSAKQGQGGEAPPTSQIVNNFYHHIARSGTDRATALQQAQVSVLSVGGSLADPFFWGAWQLYGEWGPVRDRP